MDCNQELHHLALMTVFEPLHKSQVTLLFLDDIKNTDENQASSFNSTVNMVTHEFLKWAPTSCARVFG